MIYWEKQKKIKALYEMYAKPLRLKYDLTQMQISILSFLQRNPDFDTASSIAQIGQYAKSQVSSAVKDLENRGLLNRKYSDNNNKSIHLELTDKAVAIVKELEDLNKEYFLSLFSGLSHDEMKQAIRIFEKVCENADSEMKKFEEEKQG